MAYDVSSMLESLRSTLATNTSTLMTSLTSSYPTMTSDSILIGDPKRLTRQLDQYPCLILTPKNKSQEFGELGVNASAKVGRDVVVSVDILCLTQSMSDSEDADKQARTLARNVETILETNIEKLASTSTIADGWNMAIVDNAQYEGAYNEASQTYQSSVKLETTFKSFGYR